MRSITFLSLIFLAGCSTYMPDRYHVSADNTDTLHKISGVRIGVGEFSGPAKVDTTCRYTRHITPPDKITFHAYIKKALESELKAAGMYAETSPEVVLSGVIEPLNFSLGTFSGGAWHIGLTATSSNGKALSVREDYQIDIGMTDSDDAACIHTADAYLAAVQNLVGKLVSSPDFKSLLISE